MIVPDVNVFLHIYLVKLFWGLTFQNIHMLMDVTKSLTRERERERERESEKSVCACVKETWTTHDKSREKACVSYANISHMHLRQRKQGEEIVCGCLQPREQDP